MPETRFTQLCTQFCDLIQRIRHVIDTEVIHAVDVQLASRTGVMRMRDNVYQIVFTRILRWLYTFEN
jgi:hypothetical protein